MVVDFAPLCSTAVNLTRSILFPSFFFSTLSHTSYSPYLETFTGPKSINSKMPKSNLLSLTLTLILLLLLHQSPFLSAGNDLDDLDELLSIDEELESETNAEALKPSEAEILKRAQRVVLDLNNENAKKVINENELVLVVGYTPWCPRSAELMPRFAEAAMRLKEMGSEVFMAKIDAERYGKAAGELGIRGYPTMILFVNGTGRSYTGGFTA